MGKKRGYSLEQSEQAEGQEAMIPPVVRSRRERAVRVRLRNEHGGPSSHTDSGSGDHYSPVNVTDTAREASGDEIIEALSDRKTRKRLKSTRKAGTGARSRRSEGHTKRGPGGIFKTAAMKVLTEANGLLSSGMIYDRAMRQGLVSESAGKTPEATMAAALYTDIKKYRNQSTFIKPREGLFGLRDWTSDDCTILTAAERAEVAASQESDRDSTVQISGLTPTASNQDEEQAASQKRAKPHMETSRRGRHPTKPRSHGRQGVRRARSHSPPPSERAEPSTSAQPALSEPPAAFANERLQALFMAVDQVSGTTATSELGSQEASETESEGDPATGLSHDETPEASRRASAEPEAQAPCFPTAQIGNSLQIDAGDAQTTAPGLKQDDQATAVKSDPSLIINQTQSPMPELHNPVNEVTYPLSLSSGENLTPAERVSTLQQIDGIEQHLQALDQTNKYDPQVGNCHMQLSTLYLAVGAREKAIQNYLIALERCEALLA